MMVELTAYVHYLLVNPEYQKDGIGTRLVEMIKQSIKIISLYSSYS